MLASAQPINEPTPSQGLAAIAAGEKLFHTLAENAPTMLWLTDASGGLIYFNRCWLEFTGLPMADALGDGWVNILHPDDRERCFEYGMRQIADRQKLEMEYRLLCRDGTYYDMRVLGEPYSDEQGQFAGFVGCTIDVTAEKNDQQQLRQTNVALAKHSKDIGLLNELNDNLQVCHNIDETKPILKRYGRQLFPDVVVTIALYNESRNVVEPFIWWGGDCQFDSVLSPDDCWALRKSKPHCELAADDDVICPNFANCSGKRYVCVPLLAYGEVIGNLHLDLRSSASAQNTAELEDVAKNLLQLATVASDQIALALANLKLRATLQFQSTRDVLTQLYNRRYIVEALDRELARAKRNGHSVSLLVIDVDNFKRYNDTYGHEAGDHVLRELGVIMRQSIRGSDIASRYGGEEFVIVMPDSDSNGAFTRAEMLRKKISGLAVDFHGDQLGQITVSIGIASFPELGATFDDLMSCGDAALYQAKANGRNCVVIGKASASVSTTTSTSAS